MLYLGDFSPLFISVEDIFLQIWPTIYSIGVKSSISLFSTKSSIESLQIPKAWMPHILHREVSIFNYFIFCFNEDIDLSNKATFIFDTL